MTEGSFPEEVRRWALAPVSVPPSGKQGRGKIVCNCLNVAETEIKAAISAGADFSCLQNTLKCGTECGSCVPELKRLLASS